jgi:hypothetical protein
MNKNAQAAQDAPFVVPTAVPVPTYGTTETLQLIIDEETPILAEAEVEVDEAFKLDGAPVCRDFFFALLFYAHFLLMIWLGVSIAPLGYETIQFNFKIVEDLMRQSDDLTEEDILDFEDFIQHGAPSFVRVYSLRIFLLLVIPCHFAAFAISYFNTVYVLKAIPKRVIYTLLIKSLVLTSGLFLYLARRSGSVLVWFIAVIAILAMLYYTAIAWRYAPYAAVNLKVALTGIYSNFGVNLVAATFAKLGVIWTIYWLYVTIGVFGYMGAQCRETHPDGNFDMTSPDFDNSCNPPVMVVLLFLLSLYWTSVVTTVCV